MVLAALGAFALTGLVPGDAAADPPGHRHKRGKGHKHKHCREQVAVRYVPVQPQWCPSSAHVVYEGDPYWYHVGVGAYFGGAQLNVEFGDRAPEGYGYWDPYCGRSFESVPVYTDHCARHRHEPALRVVPVDYRYGYGYPSHDSGPSVSFRIEYGTR